MKAQSIYEYIVSFIIFLVIAILLFKLMISLGPESVDIFQENSACLQATKLIEYSTESASSEKINLNYGLNKINYSKWKNLSETNYIYFKNSSNIEFPFNLNYLVKEIPLNKTDSDYGYPNATSARIIRLSSNQIKIYLNASTKATLNLAFKTHNSSSEIQIIESGCNSGAIESNDLIQNETGKINLKLNANQTDFDCLIFSVNSNEPYIYISNLNFKNPDGEIQFPVFLGENFKTNDEYGSSNIEKSKKCIKSKYIVMLSEENEEFVTYFQSQSWS